MRLRLCSYVSSEYIYVGIKLYLLAIVVVVRRTRSVLEAGSVNEVHAYVAFLHVHKTTTSKAIFKGNRPRYNDFKDSLLIISLQILINCQSEVNRNASFNILRYVSQQSLTDGHFQHFDAYGSKRGLGWERFRKEKFSKEHPEVQPVRQSGASAGGNHTLDSYHLRDGITEPSFRALFRDAGECMCTYNMP